MEEDLDIIFYINGRSTNYRMFGLFVLNYLLIDDFFSVDPMPHLLFRLRLCETEWCNPMQIE